MGASISRVSCSDISAHHKKFQKSVRRQVKIDKTKIGTPTDFRHVYHVGNEGTTPTEETADNESISKSTSSPTGSNFLTTMAQIADELQKLPLHTSTPRVAPKKIGNSISDHQITPRNICSIQSNTISNLETLSLSMIIQPTTTKNEDTYEKDHAVVPMTKFASIPQLNNCYKEDSSSLPSLSSSTSLSESMEYSPPKSMKDTYNHLKDPSGKLHVFTSCLQNKIDAQIFELARVRSKRVLANRISPRTDNPIVDKPELMI